MHGGGHVTVLFTVCSAVTVEGCVVHRVELWDGDYVRQLPCMWYYVAVNGSFNMLVRNASPRGYMCFRCLMVSMSGPCELLFLLCCIASWICVVVSVMLYPCIVCVALLMDMAVLCVVACFTVFVNCLIKQFSICLGIVVILLLNVMDVFSVCGGALMDRPCMIFQITCMLYL